MPCGRFELVTAIDKRWIRRSFRRPNKVRKLLTPPKLTGTKASKGTEDTKSIKKLPLRYEIAILWTSFSSCPILVSR